MILHAVKKRLSLRIISELFDVSIRSIRRYIERFNKYGFKGLLDKPRPGRRKKVSSEDLHILLELGPKLFGYEFEYWTVKLLNIALREKLGVEYSYNYLYQLIRRHGYSLKKPRPIHYKADFEAIKKAKERIKELATLGAPVFYMDETRVFLTTIVGRVIAKRGKKVYMRVNVAHHMGVYVFGAIDIRSKSVEIMLENKFNSSTMMKFVYRLKRRAGKGRVYLILDNAGPHKAKRVVYLSKRKGVHLEYLPPYSPQLNPVEEIWRQLKGYLSNRLFTDINVLKREIIRFFERRQYKFEIQIGHYFS